MTHIGGRRTINILPPDIHWQTSKRDGGRSVEILSGECRVAAEV